MRQQTNRIGGWKWGILAVLLWAVASLVAVAVLEYNGVAGLALALIGGIGFGIFLYRGGLPE